MRQVVLDTETTGLEPQQDHRIVEIGCVELLDRRLTGNRFHHYLNPGRDIDQGAVEVHGISASHLADKPSYAEIAADLLAFLRGAELIIHNAPFDVAFLDAELERLGPDWGRVEDHCARVVDTLVLARSRHPGQRNSLDALCKRYEVDNSGRELHGALLDAELLADVYLAMTGGQAPLGLEAVGTAPPVGVGEGDAPRRRGPVPVLRPTAVEGAAHEQRLAEIADHAGTCLWPPGDGAG